MLLPPRPAPRSGLSLMEVLVALAIFLLSFIAIGRLITLASDQALEIQFQSQATQMAQSKLNEVVAGAVPLEAQSGSFEEDPDWRWSVEAEQGSISGLWLVRVRVYRQTAEGAETSATLSQMVLDPSLRGNAMDLPAVTGTPDSSTGDSSSSSTTTSATQPTTSPASGGGGTSTRSPAGSSTPSGGGTSTPTGGAGRSGGR